MTPAHPDLFARPDPDSLIQLPWKPEVAWLASEASGHVTGRVFEIKGGALQLYGSQRPAVQIDKGGRWACAELGDAISDLLARAEKPLPAYGQS